MRVLLPATRLTILLLSLLWLVRVPMAAAATWDFATPYPETDIRSRSAQAFAAAVGSASDGRLTLVLFASGSLVAAPQIPAALRDNAVPIALLELTQLANEAPALAVSSLPLLAASYDDSLRLWNAARPVVQRLLAARGLMVLYALPAAPAALFSKGAVNTLADLQRRPLATTDSWLAALIDASGGRSVATEPGNLAAAVGGGQAKGMLVAPEVAIGAKAWTLVDNAYDVKASFPLSIVAVNQSAFYALDEDSQRALLNAAVDAQNDAWSSSVDARNAQVDGLETHRLIVQPSPPPLQEGLRQAARTVIDGWLATAGADGAAILAAFGWPAN